MRWNGKPFYIHHLKDKEVEKVVCLANGKEVEFKQTERGLLVNASLTVADPAVAFKIVFKLNGKRVLFIGDSITDGGWGRSGGSMAPSGKRNHTDLNHIYGHSYMMLCAAHLESKLPDAGWKFFNRGISGNTLNDLENRWQQDALSLNPDVVSILIGTNDISYHLDSLKNNPTKEFDFKAWESRYRSLLDLLRKQNPDVRLMLAAPFVSKDGRVGKAANYNLRHKLIERLAKIVERIAKDYNAQYLPYTKMFAQLTSEQPKPGYWIWDGIHPTPAGHQHMADMWLEMFCCDE
ncbi:MAG: SGNH/GDSL hydrolase family protein [Prevotella sp.]|nr:SGNH/GDSL hydrolase family protein [Prevotella sp.]